MQSVALAAEHPARYDQMMGLRIGFSFASVVVCASVLGCGAGNDPEIVEVTATVTDEGILFDWEGGAMNRLDVWACDPPFCVCFQSDSGNYQLSGASDISWQVYQGPQVDPAELASPVLYGAPLEELNHAIGPDALQPNKIYAAIPAEYSYCDGEGSCELVRTGCVTFYIP